MGQSPPPRRRDAGGGDADPRRLLQRAKSSGDVWQQLNLIERALAAIDPTTEYQAAVLDALNETLDALKQTGGSGAGAGAGAGGGVGADQRLTQVVNLLEQLVMGRVDTTDLPLGNEGEARVTIASGDEGLASMEFAGGRYAALVKAKEDIDKFDDIRIVEEGNLAKPVPEREASVGADRGVEREEVFDVTVDAGDNILSQGFSPQTPASSLTVGVVLDTSAEFRARVDPDDAPAYDAQFNARASTEALDADSLFQFDHDFGPSVSLNYRVNQNNVTVRQLRVVETLRS